MLSTAWRLRHAITLAQAHRCHHYSTTGSVKRHEPLRILFCGADEFSIYSLRALHALQQRHADKIQSVDVVCRPDKRVGRGLKQLQAVPIKQVAQDLDLPVHQLDTFKEWSPPSSVNLIVAVSFGLLVPARLLKSAKYGGLNVHPSLLPDLRGPAPIQHTLLKRRIETGVTLQTMHPTRFDHGAILDQHRVAVPQHSRTNDLVELLGPMGAEVLAKGIKNGIFVPPVTDLSGEASNTEPSHAPKITPEDRHIDWKTWTADEITLRNEVLGRLWDTTTYAQCMYGRPQDGLAKRVIFSGDFWRQEPMDDFKGSAGRPIIIQRHPLRIGISTMDGQIIIPDGVSIEGEPKGGGIQKLAHGLDKRASQAWTED